MTTRDEYIEDLIDRRKDAEAEPVPGHVLDGQAADEQNRPCGFWPTEATWWPVNRPTRGQA